MSTTKQPLYYGWIMVAALAITETISYGVLFYAFTVFIQPMEAELGWTRGDITLAYSLGTLVMALVGLLIGRWLDRHGARFIMSFGSLLAALLVFGWAHVQDYRLYFTIWLALGVVKGMVLYEPAFWVVSAWFAKRRRQALTLMTFVAGFSSLIFTPLTQALVSAYGWRSTLVIYALLLALTTVPLHLLILRRRPSDLGLQPDGDTIQTDGSPAPIATSTRRELKRVLRQPAFWWLTLGFMFNAVTLNAIVIHLVPYLKDAGYAPAFAALVYGLVGAVSLPGRLILTPLGDRVAPIGIAAGMFLTQALGVIALGGVQSEAFVWLFLLLFAAGYGAITPTRAALVAEFFGTAHYGTISSVMLLIISVVSAFAPAAVGMLYDRVGNYTLALTVMTLCSMASVIMLWLAARARSRV
ncbi:MAG: MFS transporter [Chloroflexota bacterium]|nr:MFS transporter [Chloroflexota bacterium]